MKILYISAERIPGSVGGAIHTLEVAKNLTKMGHEVTLLVHKNGDQKSKEVIDNITVFRTNMKIMNKTAPMLGIRFLTKRFDVVMERYGVLGGLGTLFSMFKKMPLVLEVNGPHIDEAIFLGMLKSRSLIRMLRWWTNVQYKQASKIVTTFSSLVPDFVKEKTFVIPSGANRTMFHPKKRLCKKTKDIRKKYDLENRFVVVFHGAFMKWHGVLDIVEAMPLVIKENDNIRFLFVGSGGVEGLVKEKIRNLRVCDYCVLSGKQDYEMVPYFLASGDVAVAPFNIKYYLEKFGFYWSPVKIFEYLAAGLPIITANYKPLEKIVRGCGLLYQAGDVGELAKSIIKLAAKKRLCKKLGANARKRSERYTWFTHTKKLEKILLKTMEGG